jgi:2-oxoglutarate ferredoxin oxidoreductase subunit alpha
MDPITTPASPSGEHHGRWSISGNEAAGVGAVRGGVRFVAAYPITPATELLEWLAPNLSQLGGLLVQAEDELASINMAIGASYGGTPSLTATSGPGLALMMESIGLAVASEIPLVIVNVMRAGPSTGIPTKSEQSDLNIALFGLHGDAPHLVLAPTTIADCLFTTQWATHLAEVLQTPAIVLSDQFLGQTRGVIDTPADVAFVSKRKVPSAIQEGYERYALEAAGVSAMAIPGVASGQYTADGLEHSESGMPSSTVDDHLAQLDKRRDKLTGHDYGDRWADIEGDGEIAIITWGSTTGPVREALRRLRAEGEEVRMISLRLLAPMQPQRLTDALKGIKRALVIEQNHSAQLYHYLRGHYDFPCPVASFHQPGPLPIRPGQVQARLAEWRKSGME